MTAAVSTLLLLLGTVFVLIAALGVLRLPDALMRLHAATKAGTLGAGLILTAAGVFHGDVSTAIRALITIAFIVITSPVAAHLIGRAGYRTSPPAPDTLGMDEYGAALRRPAERAGGDADATSR